MSSPQKKKQRVHEGENEDEGEKRVQWQTLRNFNTEATPSGGAGQKLREKSQGDEGTTRGGAFPM